MDKQGYLNMRLSLGILAIILPVMQLLFGLLGYYNFSEWFYSISATFYTNAGPLFIAVMGATGIFFIAYGSPYKDKLEKAVNITIGSAGLLLTFIPCSATTLERVGVLQLNRDTSNVIHCVFAGVFFTLIAFDCLYFFTKGDKHKVSKRKKNRIFIICGCLIVAFIISQAVTALLHAPGWLTMVNETGMLWSFGCAWIIKGRE